MLKLPHPTFNSQCGIGCIAVSQDQKLIAMHSYRHGLEIREVKENKTIYRNSNLYWADKISFIDSKCLLFGPSYLVYLDWEKNISREINDVSVLSDLQHYLTYQDNTFTLKKLFTNQVIWKKKIRDVTDFFAVMNNDLLLLKIKRNNAPEYQLWSVINNNKINLSYLIKKEIGLILDFDYCKRNEYYEKINCIKFINHGKELLLEQYQNGEWRAIIFSLETFKVIENILLETHDQINSNHTYFGHIQCYGNCIYFVCDDSQINNYNLKTKKRYKYKFNDKKQLYFSEFLFYEMEGLIFVKSYYGQYVIQLKTDKIYPINSLVNFDNYSFMPVFNETIYSSSYQGGVYKLNYVKNKIEYLDYNSDTIHHSIQIKDRIYNIHQEGSIAIWDLVTNKIVKRKKSKDFTNFNCLSEEDKTIEFITGKRQKYFKVKHFDFELNYVDKGILPNKENIAAYRINHKKLYLVFVLSNNYFSLGFTQPISWPENFTPIAKSQYSIYVCQEIHNNEAYLGFDSLYKINLESGVITKGIFFHSKDHKHGTVVHMQISNNYLFIGMEGFQFYIYDLNTFSLLHYILTPHEAINSFVYHADKNYVFVSSGYENTISIYDLKSGKEIKSWNAHEASIVKLFELKNQQAILSVAQNGTMKKWDINSHELLEVFYSLPPMPDRQYGKGWAHLDNNSKMSGSKHYKEYFE